MIKLKRSHLLGITIGLAAVLLIYTFLRTFTPIKLDESGERYLMYVIMFAALGIFTMNRKLAPKEKDASREESDEEEQTVQEKP